MFNQPEDELTWGEVGTWSGSQYDFSYSVILKWHQGAESYKVDFMYFVKGTHLFIGVLREDGDPEDFQNKSLIDLSQMELFTEPELRVEKAGLFSVTHKAWIAGENFMEASSAYLSDETYYTKKFTVHYPKESCEYKLKDAIEFCRSLKKRIRRIRQQSEQGDAVQPTAAVGLKSE